MLKKIASLAGAGIIALALMLPAAAQTSPNLTQGQVLTPGQWNNLFASKQDTLGYTPVNSAGGVMSGRLVTSAPGASTSGLNLTPGTTPASPVNGDLWVTSSGLFARVNGATIGPIGGATSSSFAGTTPITVSFPSGVVTYACATCGLTGNPLSQFASTTSAQLLGVLSDETGTGLAVFNGSPTFTGTITAAAANFSSAVSVTSASANAFAVGRVGTTNSAFVVDASGATQATGIRVIATTAGSGTGLIAISSGTNEAFSLNSKGSGGLLLQNVGTGPITLGTAIIYGGVTLNNAVTGTGNMVLSSGPSITNQTINGASNTMALGSDATGDIYYRNSSGFLTRLPVGSNTNVLTLSGGLPAWLAGSSAASVTVGTTTVNSGTTLNLLYNNAGTLANGTIASFLTAGYGIGLTGTTNAALAVSLTAANNVLGADVPMGTAGTVTPGPSMAQGSTGVWSVSGTVSFLSTSGVAIVSCVLWDGTNNIASAGPVSTAAINALGLISLSGNSVNNPPGNIRISCKDTTSNNTKFLFNSSGFTKDSFVYGHRIQ